MACQLILLSIPKCVTTQAYGLYVDPVYIAIYVALLYDSEE